MLQGVCLVRPVQANQEWSYTQVLDTKNIYNIEINEGHCEPATILTGLHLHHCYSQDNPHVIVATASR